MVCLGNICINTLHKGDNDDDDDDDDDDNNNNNISLCTTAHVCRTLDSTVSILAVFFVRHALRQKKQLTIEPGFRSKKADLNIKA